MIINRKEDDFYLLVLNETKFERIFIKGDILLLTFEIVRIISIICSILGIVGNVSLIYIIGKTSFRHVSYGLLIITIAFFDIIRLISLIYYYLLFSNQINLNIMNAKVYLFLDQYPIFVVNWCKVLMSIERLITIRYWEHHTHLDWRSKHKRKQFHRFTYLILFIILFGLIIEYFNFSLISYENISINYENLIINFQINRSSFERNIYSLSYIFLNPTFAIINVLILNMFVLKEIRRLPLSLQVKVKESIGILFFLTVLSILIIPRIFIFYYTNYFSNQIQEIYLKRFSILFNLFLGIEYFNHAITGYACFLSSALLRSELKNIIWNKFIHH